MFMPVGDATGSIEQLSAREKAVLALMAEGRSNQAICRELWLSPKTVESHVRSIFRKLGLAHTTTTNRRVQAVVAWLQGAEDPQDAGQVAA